jgi:dihydrofolate reductase
MRKLKLQVQTSIDGFIAGPKHEMNWMRLPWSEDLISYVRLFTAPIDTILLGKNLAEGFIPYWEQVAQDPNNVDYEGGIKFTRTPKIVFSKTLTSSKWANTTVNNGNIVDEVLELKKSVGNDIVVYGGASFVSSLIKHNLIDEYVIMINPTAIGNGISIFKELNQNITLQLTTCTKFDCGIALLKFIK